MIFGVIFFFYVTFLSTLLWKYLRLQPRPKFWTQETLINLLVGLHVCGLLNSIFQANWLNWQSYLFFGGFFLTISLKKHLK